MTAVDKAPRLPAPPTSFVGREAELAEILRLLRDPACRLLTLVGPGGMDRRPSSRAALICVALAGPIPDTSHSSDIDVLSKP